MITYKEEKNSEGSAVRAKRGGLGRLHGVSFIVPLLNGK